MTPRESSLSQFINILLHLITQKYVQMYQYFLSVNQYY